MLCKIKVANISRHQRVLKSNKMKIYFFKDFFKLSSFFSNLIMPLLFCSISSISITGNSLNAEYLYEELKIDSSTKTDGSSGIPTNPFEIVEMIRRHNSLNDATNPSDAIDDALNSFKNLEE